MKSIRYAAALAVVAALAGCGGNDSGPPVTPPPLTPPPVTPPPVTPPPVTPPPVTPPPVTPPVVVTEVPASAYAGVAAYTSFAATLAASESTEPLDADKVVAPTSETAEPADV